MACHPSLIFPQFKVESIVLVLWPQTSSPKPHLVSDFFVSVPVDESRGFPFASRYLPCTIQYSRFTLHIIKYDLSQTKTFKFSPLNVIYYKPFYPGPKLCTLAMRNLSKLFLEIQIINVFWKKSWGQAGVRLSSGINLWFFHLVGTPKESSAESG